MINKNIDIMKIDEVHLDYLMELGNIGSGNAITALSSLINKQVHVSLTSVEAVPFWQICEKIGESSTRVFAISTVIKNKNFFNILQVYTKKSIINLINILTESKKIVEVRDLDQLDDYNLSIILEMGNILSGHYASALANLLSTTFIPEVPVVVFDYLGAIVQELIAKCALKVDTCILINTSMCIEELNLKGYFCFLPSIKTINDLIKTLDLIIKK